MELNTYNYTLILLGALLGAIKASIELDKNKTWFPRAVDVLLGVFVGVNSANHFGNEMNIALCSLIALIASASGAVILEVFMQLLPNIARELLRKWIKRLM